MSLLCEFFVALSRNLSFNFCCYSSVRNVLLSCMIDTGQLFVLFQLLFFTVIV